MTAESPGPEQYFPAVQVVGAVMPADGQKLPVVQVVHVTADAPPAENELI